MLNWYIRINRIFNVVNEGTMEKNQFKKYYGWLSSRHEKGMIRIKELIRMDQPVPEIDT